MLSLAVWTQLGLPLECECAEMADSVARNHIFHIRLGSYATRPHTLQ